MWMGDLSSEPGDVRGRITIMDHGPFQTSG
jgi:hypothetical protein